MGSKPKDVKTYIVLQGGSYHQHRTIARFRVGARNEKEALSLVRKEIGKHAKLRVYYEDKNRFMTHGTVICESRRWYDYEKEKKR